MTERRATIGARKLDFWLRGPEDDDRNDRDENTANEQAHALAGGSVGSDETGSHRAAKVSPRQHARPRPARDVPGWSASRGTTRSTDLRRAGHRPRGSDERAREASPSEGSSSRRDRVALSGVEREVTPLRSCAKCATTSGARSQTTRGCRRTHGVSATPFARARPAPSQRKLSSHANNKPPRARRTQAATAQRDPIMGNRLP